MTSDTPTTVHAASPARTQRVIALAAALAALAVLLYFHFCWTVPLRNPVSMKEGDYILGMYATRNAILDAPQDAWKLLVDGRFSMWHSSLIGNLITLPLLAVLPASFASVYFSSLLMTMIAAVLLGLVVRNAVGRGSAGSAAGAAALLCFVLTPMSIALAAMYMSEPSAALAFFCAVLVYQRARAVETPGAWIIASLVLFACIYSRAERGIFLVASMFGVYCVDELPRHGWRAGIRASAVFACLGAVALVQCCPWFDICEEFIRSSRVCVTLLLCAGVLLALLCALRADARRAFWYGAPATMIFLAWISYDANPSLFTIVQTYTGHTLSALVGHEGLEVVSLTYTGSPAGAAVKAVLLLAGLVLAWRVWPGALFLLAFNAAQIVRAAVPGARYLYHVHIAAVILMGIGAAGIFRLLQRSTFFGAMAEPRRSAALAFLLLALIGVPCLNGIFTRAVHSADYMPRVHAIDYTKRNPGTNEFEMTPLILFDDDHTVREALDFLASNVPACASFTMRPNKVAFARETVASFGYLTGRDWGIVSWRTSVPSNAVPNAEFVIIAEPGNPSAYFRDTAMNEQMGRRKHDIEASGRYATVARATVGNGNMQLSIYGALRGVTNLPRRAVHLHTVLPSALQSPSD